MIHHQFTYSSHCKADRVTVLRILDDADGWAAWARPLVMQTSWERWGHDSAAGPGAVRKVGAWPVWIRELILTRDAHGQSYTVISPALFSHYLGTVTIVDSAEGGVDIDWRVEFVARHDRLGVVLKPAFKATISGLLKKMTKAAEREALKVNSND